MARQRRSVPAKRTWPLRMIGLATWWPVLFGIYLLVVAKIGAAEIVAGIVTSGVVAVAGVAATGPFAPAFPPRRFRYAGLGWLGPDVARDLVSLAGALMRTVRPGRGRSAGTGTLEEVRLPARDGEAAGMRAYAELILSLAPGGFVVNVDVHSDEADQLFLHRIGPPGRTRGVVFR